MLSPAVAGMKAGLEALKAGESESKMALPPPELRTIVEQYLEDFGPRRG